MDDVIQSIPKSFFASLHTHHTKLKIDFIVFQTCIFACFHPNYVVNYEHGLAGISNIEKFKMTSAYLKMMNSNQLFFGNIQASARLQTFKLQRDIVKDTIITQTGAIFFWPIWSVYSNR